MTYYTSTEEFDIERRVHTTNEIIPFDTYDALHSVMQNDFYKWLLGTVQAETQMNYYSATLNEEGILTYDHNTSSDECYYKMVNGEIAQNYGPVQPSLSEVNKGASQTKYHKLVIDGVLAPEFDLLLHEVYRYMEALYPDHPDFTKILTEIEFNDAITNAGAIIDYLPDNKFFEKVANSLGITDEEGIKQEASMLKIRNLLNEPVRRKFYGSKAGYRMFASDIFQNATIFPIATYLPLKPISKSQVQEENNIYSNINELNKWNTENKKNFSAEEYMNYQRQNNRVIDTYSKYYYKKFRLVDWDGNNSSYPEPEDTNCYFFGVTIPCKEYNIIEFPNMSDIDTSINTVKSNYTVESNEVLLSTQYVVDVYENEHPYSLSFDKSSNKVKTKFRSDVEIHYIETSLENPIIYKTLYVVSDIESMTFSDYEFKFLSVKERNKYIEYSVEDYISTGYITSIFNNTSISGFSQERRDELLGQHPIQVIVNPYYDGTLLLNPKETLKYYPTYTPGTIIDNNTFVPLTEPVYTNASIKLGDFIIDNIPNYDKNTKPSHEAIFTGFNFGFIKVSIDNDFAESHVQTIEPTYEKDARYGVVVENDNGDYVVFEGKISYSWTLSAGYYRMKEVTLYIQAIPETKDDSLLKAIYTNYNTVISRMEDLKGKEIIDEFGHIRHNGILGAVENGYDEQVARDYLGDDIEKRKAAQDIIIKSDKDWTTFNSWVLELMELEQLIESWRKNREYCYINSTYKDINDNDVEYIKSSIHIDSNVIRFIVGKHQGELDNDGNYVTYLGYAYDSSLCNGVVADMSYGDLSFVSIYDTAEPTKVKDLFPVTLKNKVITVTNSETGETAKFNSYALNENAFVRDEVEYNFSISEPIICKDYNSHNYNECSLGLLSYVSNKNSYNYTLVKPKLSELKIEVDIEADTEGLENVLSFNTDLAKERFKSLSVGDKVYGPSIKTDDEEIFIVKIGDNCAYLSQNLTKSGTFVLTFSVKTLTTAIDVSENYSQYKEDLYNNGLYSVTNPFEHGLWPSEDFPKVSTAILDSLPDISFFEPFNYIPSDNETYKTSFLLNMESCYSDLEVPDGYSILPSNIKFAGDLFVEYNINKLLNFQDRKGVSPILMSVDWLDYMENRLGEISRATDNVNVGVNVMMETDTTGYYSLGSNQTYTDPQIKLKFITMNIDGFQNWPKQTIIDSNDYVIPVYAQIGKGGEGRRSWFKTPDDVTYPSIYGITQYDQYHTPEEQESLESEKGSFRKVNVYGKDDSPTTTSTTKNQFTSVEDPIFEIPLGEYDTQVRYMYNNNTENNITTTQASFYAQTFSNLVKYFDDDHSFLKLNMSESDTDEFIINIDNSVFDNNNANRVFKFGNNWIPTKVARDDGEFDISYPIPSLKDDICFYYTISESITLSDIKDRGNVSFEKNSILLVYLKNNLVTYETRKFQSVGVIGTGIDIDKYDPTTEKYTFTRNSASANMPPFGIHTATDCLLLQYIRATSVFTSAQMETTLNTYDFNKIQETIETDITNAKCNNWNEYINYFYYVGDFKNPHNWEEKNIYPNNIDNENVFHTYAETYESKIGLKPGERFGVIYLDGKYQFFKIKDSTIFSRTLPISKFLDTLEEEYNVFTGTNEIASANKWGISSLVGEVNSELELPRKYINRGSFNFNVICDPKFIATGYKYIDDISLNKNEEFKFNITKGSIYYDSINDTYYCYSNRYDPETKTFDNETCKYAIKFNEQKYFKNVLKTYGEYKVTRTLEEGDADVTEQPIMNTILGINSYTNKLSKGDRILQIKEFDLRSIYSKHLEPMYFSSYSSINHKIYGITEDDNLFISSLGDNDLSKNIEFSKDVLRLAPVSYELDSDNQYTTIVDNTVEQIFESSDLDSPEIIDYKVSKSLLGDKYESATRQVLREFKYYKNNLILRVKVKKGVGNIIVPSNIDSDCYNQAIGKLNIGDKIVSGFALDAIKEEVRKVQIIDEETNQPPSDWYIHKAMFEAGGFFAVSEDGVVYYNTSCELASVTDTIVCKRMVLTLSDELNNLSESGCVVEDLLFDSDTDSFLLNIRPITSNTNDALDDLDSEENEYKGSSNLQSEIYEIQFMDLKNTVGSKYSLIPRYQKTALVKFDTEKVIMSTRYPSLASLTPPSGYAKASANQFLSLKNNSVICNIDTMEANGATINLNVFYKDISLDSGTLTKIETDENGISCYSIADMSSNPHCVYNYMGVDNFLKGSYVVPGSYWRLRVMSFSTTGKYGIYASGKYAFIKSPIATVTKNDSGVYEYDGFNTSQSFWKCCCIPVITDSFKTEIFRKVASDPNNAYEDVKQLYESIKIVFEGIEDYYNTSELLEPTDEMPSESFYKNTMKPIITSFGENILTLSDFKDKCVDSKNGDITVGQLKFYYKNNRYMVDLNGFTLIKKVITSSKYIQNVEGVEELTIPHISSNLKETIYVNDNVQVSISDLYAEYLYLISHYLFMADTHTGYNLTSNINKIVFTESKLLIIDDYGKVSSIALTDLTKVESIEDPSNWSSSEYPLDMTFKTNIPSDNSFIEQEKFYFWDGAKIIALQSRSLPMDVSIFRPASSFVCEEGIFLVGYIASRKNIETMFLKNYMASGAVRKYLNGSNYVTAPDDYSIQYNLLYAYERDSEDSSILTTGIKCDKYGNALPNDKKDNPLYWRSSDKDSNGEYKCPYILDSDGNYTYDETGNIIYNKDSLAGRVLDNLQTLQNNSRYEYKATPAVLYSSDNGCTFSKVELPILPDMIGFENDTYNKDLYYNDVNGNTKTVLYQNKTNYYISAARKVNSEFRFYVRSTYDGGMGYYYYIGLNDSGEYDYSTSQYRVMDKTEQMLGSSTQTNVNAVTGVTTTDGGAYSSVVDSIGESLNKNVGNTTTNPSLAYSSISTNPRLPNNLYVPLSSEEANYIAVSTPESLDIENGGISITDINNSTLVLSNSISNSITVDTECLLSFYTREDIDNPFQYMSENAASSYTNKYGILRLNEVTPVDDGTLANRLYSYREIIPSNMKDEQSENYDNNGYPSISEDTERVFYEWDEFETEEGVKYTPSTYLNQYGNPIRLCDATGRQLISKTDDNIKCYFFIDLISKTSLDNITTACTPVYPSLEEANKSESARKSDDNFYSLISNPTFTAYNNSVDNGYMKVHSNNILESAKEYLFARKDIEEFIGFITKTTSELNVYASEKDISLLEYPITDSLYGKVFTLKRLGKEFSKEDKKANPSQYSLTMEKYETTTYLDEKFTTSNVEIRKESELTYPESIDFESVYIQKVANTKVVSNIENVGIVLSEDKIETTITTDSEKLLQVACKSIIYKPNLQDIQENTTMYNAMYIINNSKYVDKEGQEVESPDTIVVENFTSPISNVTEDGCTSRLEEILSKLIIEPNELYYHTNVTLKTLKDSNDVDLVYTQSECTMYIIPKNEVYSEWVYSKKENYNNYCIANVIYRTSIFDNKDNLKTTVFDKRYFTIVQEFTDLINNVEDKILDESIIKLNRNGTSEVICISDKYNVYDEINFTKTTYSLYWDTNDKYWFNNKLKCFPLSNIRYFSSKLFVPYSFYEGSTAFTNKDFTEVYDVNNSTFINPITGIYLNQNGYGGNRTNDDLWTNIMPWHIDPQAFDTEYLKNTDGRYVYLTDINGQLIKSNVGEDIVDINDTLDITYNEIVNNNKTITIKSSNVSNSCTFYKKKFIDPTIYCVVDEIFLGKCKSELTFLILDSGEIINDKLSYSFYIKGESTSESNLVEVKNIFKIDNNLLKYNGTFSTPNELLTVESLIIKFTWYNKEYTKELKIKSISSTHIPSIVLHNSNNPNETGYPLVFIKSSSGVYQNISMSFDSKCKYSDSLFFSIKCLGLSERDTTSLRYNNLDKFTSVEESAVIVNLKKEIVYISKSEQTYSSLFSNKLEATYTIISYGEDGITTKDDSYNVSINAPIIDIGTIQSYVSSTVNKTGLPLKDVLDKDIIKIEHYINDRKIIASCDIIDETTIKCIISDNDENTYTLPNKISITNEPNNNGVLFNLTNTSIVLVEKRNEYTTYSMTKNNKTKNTDTIYAIGIKSRSLIRKPKFNNFYELINGSATVLGLGETIDKGQDSILWEYGDNELLIGTVSSDEGLYSLDKFIPIDKLNDGKGHFIMLKVLTQKTIESIPSTVNQEDSYVEISLNEMNTFTPDRVWFNPLGYPEPPIEFKNSNIYYRTENNQYYYNNLYYNNNAYPIYSCNEKGQVIGYRALADDTYEQFVLTSNNLMTSAHLPKEPINKSCFDWFTNKFFIKGKESNPFWQVLNISSKFNLSLNRWEQYVDVLKYQKSSTSMTTSIVLVKDRYINPSNPIQSKINSQNVDIDHKGDYIDLINGTLKLRLSKPSEIYKTQENFIYYGIQAINPFYNNEDIWENGESVKLNCYLDSTYTVNSLENLANPNDHDTEVVQVTEFGLFDKDHQLIAYATFPPIEYRTKSQHISFTCYIKNGSLTWD